MTNPVLRKLEGFGPLTDADKALVDELVKLERVVPAQTIIKQEGENPSSVHVVTSGLACRYKLLTNGKRQVVAFLLPGDFCDLQVFICRTMDHTLATISAARVADVPREKIWAMLESPTLAKCMFMAALADSGTLREWVANIGARNATHRIGHLFCELYVRLKAVGLAADDMVELPLNQTVLSEAVGLSLVHTNKSLKALSDQGLLTFKGGSLVIRDPLRLRDQCGFTPNYLHLDETNLPARAFVPANGPAAAPARSL